jgi:hypothetical protein
VRLDEPLIADPTALSWAVFAFIFGGAALGLLLRRVLPAHHLTPDSKDVVKLGMGLIATMAALVLSLLIASAKTSYDIQRGSLTQMSANVILLDRLMAHYGPETRKARQLLRGSVVQALAQMWPEDHAGPAVRPEATDGSEGVHDEIRALSPRNEAQRFLQAEALKISIDVARARWLLLEQRGGSVPMPFVIILTIWLAIIFTSFGLFAPANTTVVATLFVCALSIAGAIFLILELDRPFDGLIQLSSTPLREALVHFGR